MAPMKTIGVVTFVLLACAFGARAEDIVTLDDGTVMKGKYIKEEDGNIVLRQADGETSIIAKSRIRRMEIVQGPGAIAPGQVPTPPAPLPSNGGKVDKNADPTIANRDSNNKILNPGWANPRIAEMEDLGSTDL